VSEKNRTQMRIGAFSPRNRVFLAPMAGVSDQAFREICIGMGCGLVYTEMVSARGLHYGGSGSAELLRTASLEAGLCALQLFGNEPELVAKAAYNHCKDGRFVLVDLNMGCPAAKITSNHEGCALMRDIHTAQRVIRAVVSVFPVPVTVKIRKGWDDGHVNALEFALMAQQSGAQAVTVHGRTREQFYSGKADWEIIARIKQALHIPVIGNGDLFSPEDVRDMLEQTGCDAVMIARGAQGNPFIFRQTNELLEQGVYQAVERVERIEVALAHARRAVELNGEHRGVLEMRKHLAWYIKGMHCAAQIRQKINECTTYVQLERIMRSL
jgi:tRNA-dihydrouridine synthase B